MSRPLKFILSYLSSLRDWKPRSYICCRRMLSQCQALLMLRDRQTIAVSASCRFGGKNSWVSGSLSEWERGAERTGSCCSKMWIAGAPLSPWIHLSPHHAEKMMVKSSKQSVISSAANVVSYALSRQPEHKGPVIFLAWNPKTSL